MKIKNKILLFILFIITFLFNDLTIVKASYNAPRNDSCYRSYRHGTRDNSFFRNVYRHCSKIRESRTYTFSNGDKVTLYGIRGRSKYSLNRSNIPELRHYNAFEDYRRKIARELAPGGSLYSHRHEYNVTSTEVSCYNSFRVFLTCRANNSDPTLSADKSSDRPQSHIGEITLSSNANVYRKYRWDNSDCNNGTNFSNGDKISGPSDDRPHTLYLCAQKKANSCSRRINKTWDGTYRECTIDNSSPSLWADKSEERRKNNIGAITLHTNANIYSKYRWDNSDCNNGTSFSDGTVIYPSEGKHTLYLCAQKKASYCSNTINKTWHGYYRLDTTAPTLPTSDSGNKLANNRYYFSANVSAEGGSPIDYVKFKKENTNNESLTTVTDYSSPYGVTWNISKVDNYRTSGGYRNYTIKVTEVCDVAGNCTSGNVNNTYKVYANTNSRGTFQFNSTSGLKSGYVADGKAYGITATLKDIYGNQIIPASGINRTIDFNFNVNHNLNLNQYNNTGNAVFLTTPNNGSYTNKIGLGNGTTRFNDLHSSNGNYNFNFRVYAPTNLANDANNHDFKINNVNIDINGSLGNNQGIILNNSSIDFDFKDIYSTDFTGDQDSNGFLEGFTQRGNIKITYDSSTTTTPTSKKLLLEKAGEHNTTDDDYFSGSGTVKDRTTIFNDNGLKEFYNNLPTGTHNFSTFFYLKATAPEKEDIDKLYVKSWLRYNLGSKTITHIGDIIGGITNQLNQGLKVYGTTNISTTKSREITANQYEEGLHNINGNIDKALLKNIIYKNVYSIIKTVDTDETGKEFNNIKYFDYKNNPGAIKKITALDLENDKTIVIKGADLFISCNGSVCGTSGDYFPGIIVLKDDNGNGGNLYIDPDLNRLDAVIYTDKSILNYKEGVGEIDISNGGSYEDLKTQLFINGTLFSNNTIGGSRKDPLVCPYYLNTTCDLKTAQKYDLNYLRAGNDNKAIPSLAGYPIIIKYNPRLQYNPPKLFTE